MFDKEKREYNLSLRIWDRTDTDIRECKNYTYDTKNADALIGWLVRMLREEK